MAQGHFDDGVGTAVNWFFIYEQYLILDLSRENVFRWCALSAEYGIVVMPSVMPLLQGIAWV